MSAQKKIPMRTCIACREEKPKKEMLRVVKNAAGEIRLDFSGKLPGRGAYVCGSEACIKKLKKYRLLNKAFSSEVAPDVYDAIEEEFLRAK
ncbi:MAG TPA: YlxR family protein [Firmicutes bacterium]|mgnify:FL=1|nr:YlxR family protein [Bacillota bacterium]